ncbi:longitudinals lacking protein-like isoform X3 [Malaya genurostris]|uniref:longitudinals lacking protein-like isoform X3 n=1 Tax=Malaya genurostris TaxID=325434 RepID=UPI0026F37E4E|nr:longitudinals lacking protein-like isoform X3 [Malaya genurostris]
MDDDQQFCLRWNNHQSTLISVFDTLLENGTLVDCTLAAEGKFLKAHKVVLSACSPYFAALLSQQYDKHPIFILKDVKFQELRAMMDYMYRGEVNISQDQLAALLKAAESLQIKGLSDNRGSSSNTPSQQKQQQSEASAIKTLPPPVPVNKASGLTIENKRPLKPELLDSDVSGSREGSTSPTSRKRKKIRRRSVDTNNLIDNHDQHSNSSSHSMHTSLQPQALALTASSTVASVPATNNAATSLSSSVTTPSISANVLTTSAAATAAALKKTDSVQQQQVAEALKLQLVKHNQSQQQQQAQQQQQTQQQTHHTDDDERSGTEQDDGHGEEDSDDMDEPQSKRLPHGTAGTVEGPDGKVINKSELMIEPKNEYDDGQDENVEDLTLDEEELLDDLDQAGPSHGGEGSSQAGYAQWQMEREQSEAFMAAQDAVGGQHRDAQDILPLKSTSKEMITHSTAMPATVGTISLTPQQMGKPTTISIVKVGAGDVVTTAGTAVIPVGTALVPTSVSPSISAIGGSSTLINASTIHSNQSQIASTKKLLKPTHPRIKYSKHKNPSVQSITTVPILTIPTVTTSQPIAVPIQESIAGTTTKIELLNFSLSRKFPGQGTKTIDVSNIQQIPISTVSKPISTRYTVNEFETSTSNTSQSNDFTSGMIDDLDYSVIDDIELPDDVQVNFADAYPPKSSHSEIEDDTGESQDPAKSLTNKKNVKSEAKILNTSMDEKYALLANTSIMKNFEYTVNESVVSDNDDGEMRQYICRHCGKRYRWKSTLRRHENVECGGKEAMHQCPYCTYKAKQRGNLGVHIRKHHADMPQLESRRKSKNRESLSLIDSIKPESIESGSQGHL